MADPTPLTDPPARERRRAPRRRVRGLDTPYGQVLDLSERGACIYRKGAARVVAGDRCTLRLCEGEIDLELDATVARTQPLGLCRLEVGVEFVDPGPEARAAIRAVMARLGTEFSPRVYLAESVA